MEHYRVGVICDMHLSGESRAPQSMFLKMAVEKMKEDGIQTIVCLGDITGFGEVEGWNLYQDIVKCLPHYEVIGNSDVRDADTTETFLALAKPVVFPVGKRNVYGFNTPYGEITEEERVILSQVKSGDIIFNE